LAWCILGLIVFLTAGIPSVVFLRRRPEDVGLFPDGISPVGDSAKGVESLKQTDQEDLSRCDLESVWTKKQAIRTRAFWMLTSMQTLINFMQAGINFHIFPFLTDHGFDEITAVFVLSTIAVSAAVGSVAWGVIAEKFNVQRLIAWNLFASGVIFLVLFGVVQFGSVRSLGTGIIFFLAALQGLMQGGRFPMINITWPQFFGRRSIGSIFSFSSPFRLTANAVGPIFAAFCFDLFGSYVLPFYLFGALFFASGAISATLQPPQFSPHDVVN
jgi:sugar phosphate permease